MHQPAPPGEERPNPSLRAQLRGSTARRSQDARPLRAQRGQSGCSAVGVHAIARSSAARCRPRAGKREVTCVHRRLADCALLNLPKAAKKRPIIAARCHFAT